VSHNLDVITRMCARAAWIEHGVVRALGAAPQVVAQYQSGAQ
jgi:ABC-type polysaccharide/polyol phosphate transport system ATPase subunit